jgi:hypothetical protein
MKKRSFTFAASALVLGLASLVTLSTIQAQGPMWDRVDVTLPYSVTIGDKTLQPGNYKIEQLENPSGGGQVLLIYGDDGMKFKTMALTIPALENRTQPHTRVILNHIGNSYYFDKIWVEGKDYGYEFPLPDNVKQRELEASEAVTVAANASSVPATSTQAAVAPEPAPPAQPTTTAVQSDTTVQSETTTAMQSDTSNTANREMTDAAPAPTPAPAPVPTAAPVPELTPAPDTDEAPAMPHTDAGWLMMLLSGGTLTGLGASLRRKR